MTISNLPAPLGPAPMAAPGMPQRGISVFDLDGRESGVDWRRILSALLRFKWLIATTTLVGTIAGVGATRFLKPQYSAQAKIWIDVEGRRGPERGPTPIRSGQLLDAESWVDLLESYVVLDQVVRDQRLYVSPNAPADAQAVAKLGVADQFQAGAYRFTVDHSGQGYTLATADGVELERGTLGDSVGSRYGLRWVRGAEVGWHGATGAVGGRDPVFGSFSDMQISREQARRDRAALDRLLAQAGDSGLSAEALSVVGLVQANPELTQALTELMTKQAELRALRYKYSDAYPPVQRLLGEIATLQRQTIPTLARQLAGQLAAKETELGRRVDADSRTLKQIPARAIEEARLRRDASLAENLYLSLQQKYEEARLAEASSLSDVRVLDNAVVPRRPVKNTRRRVVLLAFFGSFAMAVVGAVLIDRVDPRVRYPDQVSREMGLTILGAVPHIRAGARPERSGRRVRPPEDVAVVVEALRGVCLNLVYTHGAVAPLVVTITSPGAGDGKSFLAANLGHTFAEAGHRTLLIDGDLRRGVLHRRLGARRRPGVSDFLRGEVPLEAIVQATPYPSFSLIGCGTRAYNAPELLGSQTMSQLFTTLRPNYDVILVDSPPLSAGVDPLILGTLTGHLVVVLRTGFSHRDVAAAKLEVLQRLPVRLLGAILNAVPAGEADRYYSYYLPGYEAQDEEAERASGGKGQPFVI